MPTRSVYQFAPLSITGQPVPLSQYRGKKILIVNTASYCGYTPQFTQLEQLHQRYGNRVEVLGFPATSSAGRIPGNDSTINSFCTGTYNVTFPMFHKIAVKGATVDPLYKFLADRSANGYTSFVPTWNFCKYLIDEKGMVVGAWPSGVSPMSSTIIDAVLR